MSNNQIVKLSTIVVLSIVLLTFLTAATYPGPYGKNSTTKYSYGELINNSSNNSTQQQPTYTPPYFPPNY